MFTRPWHMSMLNWCISLHKSIRSHWPRKGHHVGDPLKRSSPCSEQAVKGLSDAVRCSRNIESQGIQWMILRRPLRFNDNVRYYSVEVKRTSQHLHLSYNWCWAQKGSTKSSCLQRGRRTSWARPIPNPSPCGSCNSFSETFVPFMEQTFF